MWMKFKKVIKVQIRIKESDESCPKIKIMQIN